jgi:hypothetical protein
MKFGVSFSPDLEQRMLQACETAASVGFAELNARFQATIGAKVWNWPRETLRVNNKAVGSPRNIVDTGALRQSNVFSMTGPLTATFAWTTNYASYVHEGAMIFPWGNIKAKRVFTPPRPWTSAALGTEKVAGIEPYDINNRLRQLVIASLNWKA